MDLAERNRIFDALAAHGVGFVEMHFYGGHDEGGADSHTFYSPDRKELASNDILPQLEQHAGGNFLADMEEVLLEHFEYFDGQQFVQGNLMWDVNARTIHMSAEKEVITVEDIEVDL